ncbi:MAG: hypothetical protein OXF27_19295 [Acidobacteria bacterium]|nr:hypothetical protein [Acidobacteriota bacterium]
MRKGYLLTALAAAVLLAASPGIASAQSVGFVGSSGSVAETASMESGAFEAPHRITISATGVPASQRMTILDGVTLTVNAPVRVAKISATTGQPAAAAAADGSPATPAQIEILAADFNASTNEASILVVQGEDGSKDDNWRDERIRFTLTAGAGISISPNVYTLTVNDVDVAPVAKFNAPSFTLTEGSERAVALDITEGSRGAGIPAAAAASTGMVTISVSNSNMVTLGMCPAPGGAGYNTTAVRFALDADDWEVDATPTEAQIGAFRRTGRLQTTRSVGDLAGTDAASGMANFTVEACGDMAGFTDPMVTVTIMSTNLVEQPPGARGDIPVGSPLMITIDSDEAAPTLSFSPTDVYVDEGGSVGTVLLAEGMNATEVGMVKLAVEGDAMVSLMHEDTMLEEMDGYVYVDMANNNSARLTAMSHSDPDLMDGDTKYKAWKLMEGSTDANIGEGYWFRVDVMGSTAVPALPLVGQLLLALFLMAGGSRLYRRRRG